MPQARRPRSGWRGPEFEGDFPSLGWALLPWFETYLKVPAGLRYGQPLVFDGWQIDALVRFYAVHPTTGRFVYRRMILELAKGLGKSPFLAAVCWAELCGPTLFDGWDAAGEPVGKPWMTPWLQVAASAEDQTENCWGHMLNMVGNGARLVDEYDVDPGQTRVFFKGDRPGRIEPVTAKAGTRVGQPITFAGMEETWVWKPGNGGPRLARTLRANLTKSGGRSIEVTNAYEPGAGSVAEDSVRMGENGREGILLISTSAPPVADPKNADQLRPALQVIYRDAPWVDIERMIADCLDDDKPVIEVRHEFLNQHVAPEAALVADEVLRQVVDPAAVLDEGSPIALGFDGSKTRDGTGIVAVHMESGQAFCLGSWKRPPFAERDWEVPRAQIMDVLRSVFDRWKVVRMKMDPAYWKDELSQLQNWFGKDVVDRFPTSVASVVDDSIEAVQTVLAAAARANAAAIEAGEPPLRLLVDGSEASKALRDDLLAAQVVYEQRGSRRFGKLVKPEDGRLIDCAAAYTYAEQARREALKAGWAPSKAAAAPFVVWVD